MVRSKVDSVLLERMQTSFNYASNWCEETNPKIYPNKIVVISLMKRRELRLQNLVMREVRETKYQEVVLDDKRLWNSQLKTLKDKTIKALLACRGIIGLRWGLRPAMLRWIHTVALS
jgi:hypothetical protein